MLCIIRWDKTYTSAYWCGSCPIRRRTRRIHLFVADSRPLHSPAVTKLWEHSECRRQLIHKTPYKNGSCSTLKHLKLWAIQTIPGLHLDTHLTVYMSPNIKLSKVLLRFDQTYQVCGCGPSTVWALGQVKIIWSCEAGSVSFLRFQN